MTINPALFVIFKRHLMQEILLSEVFLELGLPKRYLKEINVYVTHVKPNKVVSEDIVK